MSRASALLSGLTALVLVIVIGNPPASDFIRDEVLDQSNAFGLIASSSFFLSWDVFERPFGDFGPSTVLRLGLFVVLAAILGGVAGRSTKGAALVGGWGAGMGAAIIGSIASQLVISSRFVIVRTPNPSFTDRVSVGAVQGAIAGVLPALLIGVAVAIGAKLPSGPPASEQAVGAGAPRRWDPHAPQPAPGPVGAAPPGDHSVGTSPAPAVPSGGPAFGAPPPRTGSTAPARDAIPPATSPSPPDDGDATRRIPPA